MDLSILSKIDTRDQAQLKSAADLILKKMREEKKTFHEVVGINEAFLEGLYDVGYSFYNQGKFAQASQYFRTLTQMNPRNSKYHFSLGAASHQIGEYDDAIGYFSLALYSDPTQPTAAYYLADSFIKIGDHEGAIDALKIAIEIADNQPQLKQFKERCLLIKRTLENQKII